MKRRGFALVELSLSMVLLGLLLAALAVLLEHGAQSLRSTDVRGQALGDLQLATARLSRELEQSCWDSLTVDGEAVSFLSAMDGAGRCHVTPQGEPLWQQFVVYFRDPQSSELCRRELPLPAAGQVPIRLEATDVGLGPRPLNPTYLVAGNRVMRHCSAFQPELPPGTRSLSFRLETTRPQRNQPPARCELVGRVLPRN